MYQKFVEYRVVSGSEPLRQGDVLEAVDTTVPPGSQSQGPSEFSEPIAAAPPKWRKHLCVITADCDFAFKKHLGRVTCIPFLTRDDYLLEMHIPRLRERLVKKPLKEINKTLARMNGPRISESRLREWVSEEDPNAIVSSLQISGSEAESVLKSLASLRAFEAPAESLESATSALVNAQLMASTPPTRKNAIKTVQEALQGAFSQPSGDALFISAFAPGHDDGYFAYLRHLEQVWEPQIVTNSVRKVASYRRIARLQDRYIHALVQRFAMVFMSIGLPPEYEELRNLHSELLGEQIS